MHQQPIKAFELGDIRIDRIEDVVGIKVPFDQLLVGLPDDAIDHNIDWLVPYHYDPLSQSALTAVQSWVVRTPRHVILIDTCFGSGKSGIEMSQMHAGAPWLGRLAATGLAVEDIDFVMCTHLHADHVGWNTKLVDGRWVPTFPRARYLFGRKEYDFWASNAHDWAEKLGHQHVFNESVLPCVQHGLAEFVDAGFSIDDRLFIEDAPGHTPGNTLIRAVASDRHGIFSGDIAHSALQLAYPDVNSVACWDPDQARETRWRVLSDCADNGHLLMPAHFGVPHYGRVSRKGDSFAFLPGL
ncbi:MBL fold metallo-hydrolase [Sphingobium sp. SA916]|uniref:MBL fold metallo-hydrolase n=1 Tax=Sphingobium sp. SA916 TaxID=1851207 RepID=UPI000C9FCDFD|nr:MBL fold metallo-hydrolase [Sphingobium sp. SA916]PNQ03965.1 hypothetical protein A8G00_08725 [Sphingobium sp. SA916]